MSSSILRARTLVWLAAAVLPAILGVPPSGAQEEPTGSRAEPTEQGDFFVSAMCDGGHFDLAAGAVDGRAAIGLAERSRDRTRGIDRVTPYLFLPNSIGREARDIAASNYTYFLATEVGVHRVEVDSQRGRVCGLVLFDAPLPLDIVPVRLGVVPELYAIGSDGEIEQVRVPHYRRTEPHVRSMTALPDGLSLEIGGDVSVEALADPSRYTVRSAIDTTSEPAQDSAPLAIQRLTVNTRSGTEVKLRIPQLAIGRLVSVDVRLPAESGEEHVERVWYTLRQRPAEPAPWRAMHEKRVLVFSRTTGFRHGSIPDGWRCFSELAIEHAFTARITEDPAYFNDRALAAFDAVVFLNTTGDVLDEEQQRAFEHFVERGGGFLGVHSASDTEYDWPWYGELVAAYFKSHPRIQDALVRVQATDHPATSMLPAEWPRTDEWYNFREPPRDSVDVLLALDQDSYEGSEMPRASGHPIAWCHTEAGGRAVYTAGGHTKASYTEPLFRAHLFGALSWAAGWSE